MLHLALIIYGDKYVGVTLRTWLEGICLLYYLLRVTFLKIFLHIQFKPFQQQKSATPPYCNTPLLQHPFTARQHPLLQPPLLQHPFTATPHYCNPPLLQNPTSATPYCNAPLLQHPTTATTLLQCPLLLLKNLANCPYLISDYD